MEQEEKAENGREGPERWAPCSTPSRLHFAEHIAGLLQEEASSLKASAGFVERVMKVVEREPRRGSASRRYEKIVRGESRRWKKFMRGYGRAVIASAAAAVVFLALSARWYFKQPVSSQTLVEAVLQNSSAATRYRQRLETTAFVTQVVNGRADVSGIIPDGPVYLVGQRDDMTGEICIFAYREDQWRALDEVLGSRGDEALKEAWATVCQRAKLSDVHGGQLGIPEDLRMEYLDNSGDTAVFAFTDRNELWNPENLTEYRRGPVRIQPHPSWGTL